MIVFQTRDDSLIKRVMLDPVIFDAISEDNTRPEDLVLNPEDVFIVGVNGQDLVGLVIVENNAFCHVHVLPEKRKYSKEFGLACLEWIWRNTDFDNIFCSIPVIFPNVLAFVESFRFKRINTMVEDWLKNGTRHDSIILTLARS